MGFLTNLAKSITTWLILIVGAAPYYLPVLAQFLPPIKPYLPHNLYAILFPVVVIGNLIVHLRAVHAKN